MISVVIPMYNSEETIGDCICSVINQSRGDIIDEIIVVDDGSEDNSVLVVEKLSANDQRIKIIKKKNGGVSSARNAGIRKAKAKWIALLDSDDIWLSQKIEEQWKQIEQYPQIRFIGCNRNKENVRWGKKIHDNLYQLSLRHILIRNWPHTSTALIRRDVFKKVGLFNEKMRYAEDGDMWNRIACSYPLYYIPVSYEIAGGYKVPYGESGLSSNLKGMYEGNIRNIKVLRSKGIISPQFYTFLRFYYSIKCLKRMSMTKLIFRNRKTRRCYEDRNKI